MMRRLLLVATLLGGILASAGSPALAQSRMERATAAASAQGDVRSPENPNAATAEKPAATAMPTDPGSAVLSDPATRQRYLDAMQRYYEDPARTATCTAAASSSGSCSRRVSSS